MLRDTRIRHLKEYNPPEKNTNMILLMLQVLQVNHKSSYEPWASWVCYHELADATLLCNIKGKTCFIIHM